MEEILQRAEQLEKKYDWVGAAESYEKALNLLPQDDFSKIGEVHERLGNAFYRLAFQAESKDEFTQRLRQAILSYEKAKELYGKLTELVKTPKMLRCKAMIAFSSHWLASEASEKKKLLDECWRLTKNALKACAEAEVPLEYGKTYTQLGSSAFLSYVLEWNFQSAEKTIREAMEHGEQAVTLLSCTGVPIELAKAYVRTSIYLTVFGSCFNTDIEERKKYHQKGQSYWQKAIELSARARI